MGRTDGAPLKMSRWRLLSQRAHKQARHIRSLALAFADTFGANVLSAQHYTDVAAVVRYTTAALSSVVYVSFLVRVKHVKRGTVCQEDGN